MTTEQQPPTGAAISRGGDAIRISFRVFAARLDPAMSEALRTHLHLAHGDLDKLFPQATLVAALAELTGEKE